jgi:hypothetical protein
MVSWTEWQDAEMVVIQCREFRSLAKITGRTLNPLLNTIMIDLTPYEGTIHPYPLAFDPPLIEQATEEGRNGSNSSGRSSISRSRCPTRPSSLACPH